eukprot:CAMPEP_0176410282 /NCGR_PEP_ID=MMETSP0127-20121128/2971_1 /TAXON_ID=938130 /ORGANISM="Platyophrya macrostoma, Strain WH" /LENGTH=259 /DNA_ID=CAMNT_0017789763 /DNA_START=422 /DNA_END=1198 /DNA_ORIENTATION=-
MKEEKASMLPNSQNSEEGIVEESRINNELLVLKHFQLKDSSSQYVAKFYQADEINKQSVGLNPRAILMEYYPHKSLDHFRMKQTGMSVNTMLWFLIQTANGLRFLKNEGVYHLDIKGSNILVQTNYTLRLIDFGESYLKNPHPKLNLSSAYEQQFKPGRTLPYASPEIVSRRFKASKLHERTDIFSFGMMMGELLFENFLINFKKSNLPYLNTKYQNLSYKTNFSEEEAQSMGPKKLYLRSITMLCLHPDPNERPTHEW